MNSAEKYSTAIQTSTAVDLPANTWREWVRLVFLIAILVVASLQALSHPSPGVRAALGLVVLLLLIGVILTLKTFTSRRPAIRISPEGMAVRDGKVVPWEAMSGAVAGKNTGGEHHTKRVLVTLTASGEQWAESAGWPRLWINSPTRTDGLLFPVVRGCSHEETAEVLSAAIRTHRQRLGLPTANPWRSA